MKSKPKFYLSTSIAYASGIPHIGNVYEVILTDAIARFKRLDGYDVFFKPEPMNTDKKLNKWLSNKPKNRKHMSTIFLPKSKEFMI